MGIGNISKLRNAVMQFGKSTWASNRPLSMLVLVSAVFLVVCLVNLFLDRDQINNEIAWIKPTKFSISFLLYAATMIWLGQFIKSGYDLFHRASVATLLGATVELIAITLQVFRGTTSHFNTSTPFDHAVFIVIKIGIIPVAGAVLVSYILMLKQRELPAVIDSALHWGLFLTLVGCIPAVLMLLPDPLQDSITQYQVFNGHTVGHPEGGPGLPFLGWSTVAGDMRASHFLGIHALQVLPLAGWIIKTFFSNLSERRQRALVWNVGYSYLAAVVILMWQALRAESLINPGRTTVLAAGCVFGLSLVCALTTFKMPPGFLPPSFLPRSR